MDNSKILPHIHIPSKILTFITLALNLSTATTFPINQLATITPTLFSALQPSLQRNFKPFPIILATCPFHFTSCKQQISIQRLFKVSDITPHFPGINPTFHVKNWIPNYTSGDVPIIRAQVQSIFLAGFNAFFLM